MTTTLCKWLDECEDRLWRMTRGVFHFLLHWLPEWIIRVLLETVGPGGGPGGSGVLRPLRLADPAVRPGGSRHRDSGPVLGGRGRRAVVGDGRGGVGLRPVPRRKKHRANAAASAMDAAPPPVAHLLPG